MRKREMMRAAAMVARRRIEVLSVPRPKPGRGEVLVRIMAVGVCRSDLHYFLHGQISGQKIKRFPQVLGHEAAGMVVSLGPGARGPKPGTRVAIEPAVPCGKCRYCRNSMGNVCSSIKFLGMPGLPGALVEFLPMPAGNVMAIPGNVSYPVATALEPMAIGMHAVGLLGNRRPESALVVGAGPIGLCTLAALRLRRVRVTVCDHISGRLKVARRMGAASVHAVRRGANMEAVADGLGRRYAAVFEAGGTEAAVRLSMRAAAPGGAVALIGIPDADTIRINPHDARRKELTLINVRRSNNELEECIRLAAAGRLDLSPMLGTPAGLSQAQRIFRAAAAYREKAVKPVINPSLP